MLAVRCAALSVLLGGVVAAMGGCAAKPAEPLKPVAWSQEKIDTETKAVYDDLKSMHRAFTTGDTATTLAMVPDKLIEALGGADEARQTMRKAFDDMSSAGIVMGAWVPGKPQFFESANYEFAIVPTTTTMSVQGKSADSSTVQVGSRKKGTSRWLYVDAARMRQAKQNVIDEFPDDHPLPKATVELKP